MACPNHEPYRPTCPNCGRNNIEWTGLLEQRDQLEATCRFYLEQIQHGNLRPRPETAVKVGRVRETLRRLGGQAGGRRDRSSRPLR